MGRDKTESNVVGVNYVEFKSSLSSIKPSKKKKRFLKDPKDRFVFICLVPILLLFLIFSFVPMVTGIALSFSDYNPLNISNPFIGLANYVELFKDPIFYKAIRNTTTFVIFAVGINIVVATLICLAINNVINKFFKDFFRTLFFLPTIAPIVAAAIIWVAMLDPAAGTISMILSKFGIDKMIYWIADPKLVIPAIIIMTLWQDIGYNIVIILSGLQGIPRMFYEAAYIDGASGVTIFFKITLPLLVRTMLFVSIMTILSYFQVFSQVQVMSNGGPDYASMVLGLHIYDNAFKYMRMGYASAEAVILLVIMLIISLMQIKFIKADWEY